MELKLERIEVKSRGSPLTAAIYTTLLGHGSSQRSHPTAMSTTTFTHEFHTESFKGKVSFPTGIFINGQFSAGFEKTTIEYVSTMI